MITEFQTFEDLADELIVFSSKTSITFRKQIIETLWFFYYAEPHPMADFFSPEEYISFMLEDNELSIHKHICKDNMKNKKNKQ